MRAMRTRGPTDLGIVFALLAALGLGAIACGGSTPMDMWITKDPDAGTGFEAPVRETRPSDTAPDTSDDTGSGGTTGTGGTGGVGGDGGTTGTAGDGAGGGGAGAGGGGGGDTGGTGGAGGTA
jgi:hypothetical protein